MSISIEAPAAMGGTVTLTGDQIGPFLLHRSAEPTFVNDQIKHFWCVSHIETGMRFPWQFATKTAGRRFAKQVQPIVDWSAVKCEMRREEPWSKKSRWTAGAPTREQTAAIYAAAAECGALTA